MEMEIYCFTSHRSFVRPISFASVRSLRALPLTAHFFVDQFLFSLSIMQAVKHETLTQCRAIVGPPSTTLSQH